MTNSSMNRREVLLGTLGTTLALPSLLRSATAAGRRKGKPNLLFIWTDEQRADTMAAYGNHKIQVPHLNQLAEKSVVFERAYVTQPVCTPSRSTVMTGLWPHSTGCTANNIPLPMDVPCMPELLDDSHYKTGYMGKWHLGDEIFAQHGFQEWKSIEYYDRYYRHWRDRSKKPDYHNYLIEQGYLPNAGGGQMFSRAFAARLPIDRCKPKFLEQHACDFIRRHRKEPFMLYVNFLEPHMPFFGPLDDLHRLDQVDLPANYDDPLDDDEPLRYRVNREHLIAKYGGRESVRRLIGRYWGLCSQVDRSVGVILGTLEKLGLADNTIVVYTSDHGDLMGSHRMVEKCTMFEEATRVPLLMRFPQLVSRQKMVPQRVSHVDLVPTLLELLGRDHGGRLPGRSLVPLLEGKETSCDDVFIQWNPGQGAVRLPPERSSSHGQIERVAQERTRTVVTQDGWKLCLSDLDKCQLFDLNRDPYETTNLFYTDRHEALKQRLAKKIFHWQEQHKDRATVAHSLGATG